VSFDLELTGRRALVTAGTKGIGAAVVEVLHNAHNATRGRAPL
jgi:NAD(P)-dependent dehydrogenase (short-subunit alcohol dehydrogenase family)